MKKCGKRLIINGSIARFQESYEKYENTRKPLETLNVMQIFKKNIPNNKAHFYFFKLYKT